MSNIEDQFAAEEAHMAAVEAKLAEQRAELGRLWKAAKEEVKQKAEEEQRWREGEERAEEEQKWKEEEERQRAEERRHKEVEEWKRAGEEKKWKEELRKQIALEKQKQSETEERWEMGETEGTRWLRRSRNDRRRPGCMRNGLLSR